MVELRPVTEENFDTVINMKRPEGENFVYSNLLSLAQAWLYRAEDRVHPFAIYSDGVPVGFTLLDENRQKRCLHLWRIMFPEEHKGKGYGTQAIRLIIERARQAGAYDCVTLDCDPNNSIGKHVYTKLGFAPTGVWHGHEMEMRLPL